MGLLADRLTGDNAAKQPCHAYKVIKKTVEDETNGLDVGDRDILRGALDNPDYSAYALEQALRSVGVLLNRARISEHRNGGLPCSRCTAAEALPLSKKSRQRKKAA